MVETRRSSSSKRPLPTSPPPSSKRSKAAAVPAPAEASSSTNDATVATPVEALTPVKESGSAPQDPEQLQSSDPDILVASKLVSSDTEKSPDAEGEVLVAPPQLLGEATMSGEISKAVVMINRAKKRAAKAGQAKSAPLKSVKPSDKVAWAKLLSQSNQYPHKEIYGNLFTVGESRTCDLVLNDPSSSGILCKLKQLENGGTLLEVTGSKGLVQVNGKSLTKPGMIVINGGDEVVFSSSGRHAYVSLLSWCIIL